MSAFSATILNSAYRAARGVLKVEKRPGYCLKLVRQVVEDALNMAPGDFYRVFVFPHFHLRPGETPEDIRPYWARGAERALRSAGFALPGADRAEPGDLLFSYRSSRPYGHVGILLHGKLVLENTYAKRGWREPDMGAVRITPMREWDPITTVVRLRPVE